jgi:hypothetical protein
MKNDSRKRLRILLMENDVVLADVARSLGCTSGNITNVLRGLYPSRRVVEAVAERLCISTEQLERFIPRRVA